MMRSLLVSLGILVAVVSHPAVAQDLTASTYAQVRGWQVNVQTGPDGFYACSATSQGGGNALTLALTLDGWQVWVPSNRTDAYDGGGIAVDNRPWTDSQFGFWPHGGAYANVTPEMINMIAAGSTLRTQINGANAQSWSLSGSAAAIGKVTECVDVQFGGTTAAATAPAVATPANAPTLADACPAPGSVRSGAGLTAVYLTFANGRSTALSMVWLDESGRRETFATLQPGETVDIDTYAEHRWLAVAPDGSCPGGVIAPEPSDLPRYTWEIYAD